MTVKNVYIFVADALRADFLPDTVEQVGEYLPTIAAGTNSPAGFASIVSGLYPNQHGVHAFTHRLDPEFNVLTSRSIDYDTRFFQVYETELSEVLGMDQDTTNPVPDLEDPFVVLERDMTTHAPYGHPHYEDIDIGAQEYFGGKNVDWDRIRSDYRTASVRVGERFHQRLEDLQNAGKLDETLVIFTADHGEILGEYSEMSHGEPLIPELVKVPTVFVHPDQDTPKGEVMSHVDILPTVTDQLEVENPWKLPGRSVFANAHESLMLAERRSKPHTLQEFSFQNYYEYYVRSVWDADGGYVFNQTGLPGNIVHAFRQIPLFNPLRGRDAIRAFNALYHHVAPRRKFGAPQFSQSEARSFIREMDDFEVAPRGRTEEISEEARKELEHLGYI